MKNRWEDYNEKEKRKKYETRDTTLLAVKEYFVPERSKSSFLLRLLFHGLAITRFFSDFLGFRA